MRRESAQLAIGIVAAVASCAMILVASGCRSDGSRTSRLNIGRTEQSRCPRTGTGQKDRRPSNPKLAVEASRDKAVKNLVAKVKDRHALEHLRLWALRVLAQSTSAGEAATRALNVREIPDFVREFDSQHGEPLVIVRTEADGISPSVMLTWGHGGQMWGLLLCSVQLSPVDPWLTFLKVEPGIFAFYFHPAGSKLVQH